MHIGVKWDLKTLLSAVFVLIWKNDEKQLLVCVVFIVLLLKACECVRACVCVCVCVRVHVHVHVCVYMFPSYSVECSYCVPASVTQWEITLKYTLALARLVRLAHFLFCCHRPPAPLVPSFSFHSSSSSVLYSSLPTDLCMHGKEKCYVFLLVSSHVNLCMREMCVHYHELTLECVWLSGLMHVVLQAHSTPALTAGGLKVAPCGGLLTAPPQLLNNMKVNA